MAKTTKTTKKTKSTKSDVEKLQDILFDTLGEHISPKKWKVDTNGSGRFMVICDAVPASREAAWEDVDRAIAGTKYEGKVHVFFPM